MGGGGWLDQVGIRLTQLSTKLKLMLKLSLAIGEYKLELSCAKLSKA